MNFDFSLEDLKNRQLLIVAEKCIDELIINVKNTNVPLEVINDLQNLKVKITEGLQQVKISFDYVKDIVLGIKKTKETIELFINIGSSLAVLLPFFEFLFSILV